MKGWLNASSAELLLSGKYTNNFYNVEKKICPKIIWGQKLNNREEEKNWQTDRQTGSESKRERLSERPREGEIISPKK